MYSGIYEITEHVYEIRSQYEEIHRMCGDYVSDKPAETVIEISAVDLEYELERSKREAEIEGAEFREPPLCYLETLAVYRRIATHATSRGMVLFHGSAIAVDGVAYVFTAKSGTGKSTHTAIWRRVFGERAVMVNDDKPIIGLREGKAFVYGTPWNGKHGLGSNISAPLKGICFLSRGEKNVIKKLENKAQILPALLNQTFRPADPVALKRTLEILDGSFQCVGFYKLECNMDDEAALVSYNGMNS